MSMAAIHNLLGGTEEISTSSLIRRHLQTRLEIIDLLTNPNPITAIPTFASGN
jgi:hypothetical protein